MLKYDIILYMDCIRKIVFDAKLYLHIIKIEKQKIRYMLLAGEKQFYSLQH